MVSLTGLGFDVSCCCGCWQAISKEPNSHTHTPTHIATIYVLKYLYLAINKTLHASLKFNFEATFGILLPD